MTQADVTEKLRAFLQSRKPGGKLSDTTHLREEWHLTSLGILETISFVEDEFDVRLTQADINPASFATVVSLAALVHGRMA